MPKGVYVRRTRTAEERFWAKVAVTPACWLWTASTQTGYGRFFDGTRFVLAHRHSWLLHGGEIPAEGWHDPLANSRGAQLRHKCRVRECVNPAHLYIYHR